MSGLDTFLSMGGYARFVWPAYGVAALVLIGMAVQAVGAYRRTKAALEAAQGNKRGRGG
ncbi:MAG TPA: heme exporter protein CcmD [Magnetospirillaceae bacterium]|jgi:heme exporter protein D